MTPTILFRILGTGPIQMNIPSPRRKVVMLVVDQFGAGMTSAYGNTCFDTAHLNSLAASSLVFDFAMIPSPELEVSYPRLLSTIFGDEHRFNSCLITDSLELASSSICNSFDEVITTQLIPAAEPAPELENTELAQFFAQVSQWIASPESNAFELCWLHCRGLAAAWDAPYALRESIADEDDPAPPNFIQPPSRDIGPDSSPDEILGIQQACAAQVVVFDQCLGVLLEQLQHSSFNDAAFGFVSLRGFPLGEHGQVGLPISVHQNETASCYSELIHVPAMIRFPAFENNEWPTSSLRYLGLVTPESIMELAGRFLANDHPALTSVMERYATSLPKTDSQWIVTKHGNKTALLTHAWKLIVDTETDEAELYAKPDDRWEVNDVSRRCPAIVELMLNWLNKTSPDSSDKFLPEELVTRQ